MALNPATTHRLMQVWHDVRSADYGGRTEIIERAGQELRMSTGTIYRHLSKVGPKAQRRRRSDAGSVALTRDEALVISAYLQSSVRKNDKRLLSIGQAVETLRANGEVRAEYTHADTGEIRLLSDSAISNALRVHKLHPDQLNQPAPATELRSLHPNHVWQIDASLCVLYYLNARTEREAGLQVMDAKRFYKNKPANLKRVEADRVWSYEWTDHYSGAIGVRYVMGAESAANITDVFIHHAIQAQGDRPFHGVPFILQMDMGSANTSGLLMNLLRRLGIKAMPHAPENARATGQVEKARDIIERSFESSLRVVPVNSLDDLNAKGERWASWYNAHKTHSRHGQTRYDCWMTIGAQQLRMAPPADVCHQLLTHTPEERKVSPTLSVQFQGREFDVSDVPDVMVGAKLQIAINPYQVNAACVVLFDEGGNEVLHTVPEVARNDAGFRLDANVIGEDWRRPAATVADTHRKEVLRVMMDAPTDAEAEARQKAKTLPFGGRIDPYKPIEQAPQKTYLPRQGTELTLATTPSAPAVVLVDTVTAMLQVVAGIGRNLSAEEHAFFTARYAGGVPEDQVKAVIAQYKAPPMSPEQVRAAGGLRAV